MIYLFFALAVILVNLIPVFAPPTWTLIVFFLNYYNLNIFAVIIIAVFAATIGRFFLYNYVQKLSNILFNEWEEKNLEYLGEKIGKTPKSNFIFTFLYSITPLSTSALFVAASIARVNRFILILGFFCGRLVSYSFLAFSSKLVVDSLSELSINPFSWQAIVTTIIGLLLLLFFAFIDWRKLLEDKKLSLNFKIWRWYH
jgi:membrane protein YqaA with SNARE-associated domain